MFTDIWNSYCKPIKLSLDDIFATIIHSPEKKCLPKKQISEWKLRSSYPVPSELKVSTMTATCYLSTLVHMKPVFYLIDLFDKKRLTKNETEISELHQAANGDAKFFHALSAFLVSNNVKWHPKFSCPLSVFKKQFGVYYQTEFKQDAAAEFSDAEFINMFNLNVLPGKPSLQTMTAIYPKLCNVKFSKIRDTLYDDEPFVIGLDIDPLFPAILNIKYRDVARGDNELASKKKKTKKAFFNQCTMRIALDNFDKIINLKVFKNGKLHMTGCRHTDDAQRAIDYLIVQLERLSYDMYLKNQAMVQLRISLTREPKNVDAFAFGLPLWERILVRCNAWDLQNWVSIFPALLTSHSFWLRKSERDFRYKFVEISPNRWKVAHKYDERTKNYKRIFKSSIFDDPCKFYFLHFEDKERMPFIPLNPGAEVKLVAVNVEMINSDFETHFNINQTRLTEILRAQPFNLFVKYDPLNYPGVNIKYECLIPENNPKDITILVFRTGQVIITGGTCNEHLQQSYQFINNIFHTYYSDLWVPSDEDTLNNAGSYY